MEINSMEAIKNLEKPRSMAQIVFAQFLENKAAVAGVIVILIFTVVALAAPWIQDAMNIDPDDQDLANHYLPMASYSEAPKNVKESLLHNFIAREPEKAKVLQDTLLGQHLVQVENPEDALFKLLELPPLEFEKLLISTQAPEAQSLINLSKKFKSFHLFGTDEVGRDVFIRLIYGTRISMGVGILTAVAAALVGLLIGAFSGFYGGFIDTTLMRVTDALLALPTMPVLIVIAAVDIQKVPFLNFLVTAQNQSIWKLVFILCLFSWMQVARLVRGSVLSIREREFILAARTLGANDFTIVVKHLFPNVIAPMLVSISLGVGESILYEAALSFLGLGIQPPTPSWGNMLNKAQELIFEATHLAILPGLLILLTTISFNFIGDGLQDAIDPKTIKR